MGDKDMEWQFDGRTNNENTVCTQQNLYWYLVQFYLDGLHPVKFLMDDEGFRKIFNRMEKYVLKKIELPSGGDILDNYVVVVQEKEVD